jgi:ribose/xylose/arabinose/galactoside ABC-type transport system permease subunit
MGVSILAALAFCGAIGFATGLAVGFLRMAPLIATLGSMWVVQGVGYWFLKGVPAVYPVASFRKIFAGNLLFLPFSAVYLVVVAALIVVWLTHLRTGRWVYAVGGSDYAAAISGINVPWVKTAVYTASAVLSGFGGILVGAYSSVGYPRACNGYELYAIAAVVMGGFAFTGGEGNIWNALFGILVLRLLNKLVIFSGLSGYLEGMVVGAILVITLLLASRRIRSPRRPGAGVAEESARQPVKEVQTK